MEIPIPAIPNEIITEILSHLGKNDLLVCRLVSQSWNKLSLKILRNPKFEHEHDLTQDNIQKFLEFFNERNEEWVLPFHLNFTRDDYETPDYHQNPKYIQQLQSIFGVKCVGGLTLTHVTGSSLECVNELISILTLVAPSLTHLDLSEFHMQYHGQEEKVKAEDMLEKTQLNFPNLSKLKSCPAPALLEGNHSEQDEKNNKIHSFLIEKSQNLKDLEVLSPYNILAIEQMRNIRKLKIEDELYNCVSLLEPIGICPTPNLKELSLFCMRILSVLDYQILHDFLSSLSTSLQSLTIEFEDVPTNPFPRLSQLKFLRIKISRSMHRTDRIWVNPEELNLTSGAFPVLESIDISANVCFESTDAEDDWYLQSVKTLTIRMMYSPFSADVWDKNYVDYVHDPYQDAFENEEIFSRVSAKDYVDQLQKLFPNVTSFTIVNECGGREANLNELLIAFIQSDGAPRIRELEIQNYEKNYLGKILNGLDPEREPRVIIENVGLELDKEFLNSIKKVLQGFSGGSDLRVDRQLEIRDGVENSVITCKAPIIELKMTGLEKIRMSLLKNLNRKSTQSGIEQESNQKDLFLMSLPKYFPLLRQIDISQRMFGVDKDFCREQIVQVQEKFPDLFINTN